MIFEPSEKNIHLAADYLKDGNLVAFPTETVYGLGANAKDSEAIEKIYKAKNRPSNNPLIVHIHSVDQISEVADINKDIRIKKRVEKLTSLLPAPLSFILPRNKNISELVCLNQETIAVRIPNHPIALRLLKTANIPIAAPSANKSGYVSPTKAKHVEDLGDYVSMIIDGGECEVGIESTVISLIGEKVSILMPGIITKKTLEECLDEEVQFKTTNTKKELKEKSSPGLDISHYSPQTKLVKNLKIFSQNDKAGVLLFSEKNKKNYPNSFQFKILSKDLNRDEIAHNLYSSLRELDLLQLDYIILEDYNRDSIGHALFDRLERATYKSDNNEQ